MKLKLVKKNSEAKGTVSFFFQPEKGISWLPGQYYYYTLPSLAYADPRGHTRDFTISASPTEGDLLRLTTRIRQESGYKKTLDELEIGSVIEGEGPNGTFILDESEKGKSHVFLAGGIGITPFRAFIKYNIDKNLQIPMHLIYSNSLTEEIAFRKELEEWSENHEFFKLSMTVTHPEESKEVWNGPTGRIDEKMLSSLATSSQLLASDVFWIVGPPTFVSAMEEVLGKMKVGSDKIRIEKFSGY